MGPEVHGRTHTAGGLLLLVGAVLLRAGWKETLKLQRGKDRWPVWQLRVHTHAQTTSSPNPLLCTPAKVPNNGPYLIQLPCVPPKPPFPFLSLPALPLDESFSLFALFQAAPLCKHSPCKLAAWLTFNCLLKRHFLLMRIPPWKLWLTESMCVCHPTWS